jgi:hypothetical protein
MFLGRVACACDFIGTLAFQLPIYFGIPGKLRDYAGFFTDDGFYWYNFMARSIGNPVLSSLTSSVKYYVLSSFCKPYFHSRNTNNSSSSAPSFYSFGLKTTVFDGL